MKATSVWGKPDGAVKAARASPTTTACVFARITLVLCRLQSTFSRTVSSVAARQPGRTVQVEGCQRPTTNDQRLPFGQPALFYFVGSCLNDVLDGRSNALRIGRLAGRRPNQLVAAQIVNKGFNLDFRVVAPWHDRKSIAPAVRIIVPE